MNFISYVWLNNLQNPFQCDCSIGWIRDDYTVTGAQCLESDTTYQIKDTAGQFGNSQPRINCSLDTWPCEPVLHMPSLRKDSVFQEYENEVVRIGCYTTTNGDGDFDVDLNC